MSDTFTPDLSAKLASHISYRHLGREKKLGGGTAVTVPSDSVNPVDS